MHLLSATRAETYDGSGAVALDVVVAFTNLSVLDSGGKLEIMVELQDEIVTEIVRNTSAVAGGVAYDAALGGKDAHFGTAVIGVEHNAGTLGLGEGEAEDDGTFRGCHLCRHVVVGQQYAVIVGQGYLALVAKPTGAVVIGENQFPCCRHDGELTVVVHPGTGLVGLLEAANFVGVIGINPSVAHRGGLRSPEVHAPRQCRGRIGVSCGEFELRLCANQCADVINGGLLHTSQCAGGGQDEGECKCNFFLVHHHCFSVFIV